MIVACGLGTHGAGVFVSVSHLVPVHSSPREQRRVSGTTGEAATRAHWVLCVDGPVVKKICHHSRIIDLDGQKEVRLLLQMSMGRSLWDPVVHLRCLLLLPCSTLTGNENVQ